MKDRKLIETTPRTIIDGATALGDKIYPSILVYDCYYDSHAGDPDRELGWSWYIKVYPTYGGQEPCYIVKSQCLARSEEDMLSAAHLFGFKPNE